MSCFDASIHGVSKQVLGTPTCSVMAWAFPANIEVKMD